MTASSDPTELGSKDASSAGAVLEASRDPDFGAEAQGLRRLREPAQKLSRSAKGCDCPDDEVHERKGLRCNWKSCWAVALIARLRAPEGELLSMRGS